MPALDDALTNRAQVPGVRFYHPNILYIIYLRLTLSPQKCDDSMFFGGKGSYYCDMGGEMYPCSTNVQVCFLSGKGYFVKRQIINGDLVLFVMQYNTLYN